MLALGTNAIVRPDLPGQTAKKIFDLAQSRVRARTKQNVYMSWQVINATVHWDLRAQIVK